jgi:hypothetical protein
MRSFSLRILANNEAGSWPSWPEKIAAIKAFYTPVCELDIILTPTKLTPQFAPYSGTSGNGTIYQVDEGWYEANVLPLADGADMVMFVVPPTDHTVPCLIGLCVSQTGKAAQLTVFSNETDHTYVNGSVDQGETAVVYAEHELSHAFYAMLAKTDNTHLYFYVGTPEKVLADFDFDEVLLNDYQQLIQDLELKLGLLKARRIPPIADLPPSETQNSAPTATQPPKPPQPSSSLPSATDLFNFIKGYEGWAAPGEMLNGVTSPNGSISYQCNNPMNAKWANQEYATPRTFEIAGRQEIFAAFDTLAHGTAYGIECLTMVINGTDEVYNVAAHNLGLANSGELTLNQFFAIRDAASDGNNPDQYAAAAGKQFGVTPATFPMKQFTLS